MKLKVKVIPRSSKESIELFPDGSLKVKLKSPPVEGKANRALIRILSRHFKISKTQISIISGRRSRNKLIKIEE